MGIGSGGGRTGLNAELMDVSEVYVVPFALHCMDLSDQHGCREK